MKQVVELLRANARVSDYKINFHQTESYQLFFVKGKLETVRCTDVCDKEVTIYVDHEDYRGSSSFLIYPSTTEEELRQRIDETVDRALLIHDKPYALPENETGEFTIASNFSNDSMTDLAAQIAQTVFAANTVENGSLNSVEIFIDRHTVTVVNSRGVHKTQRYYSAMVEAIPTYNGEQQSVELYEQYRFNRFDAETLRREIAGKMDEVKARCEATTPATAIACDVILNRQELNELFYSIADNLNFSAVYAHRNVFEKGDAIQKDPDGDRIGITMRGETEGSVYSAKFDGDGLTLHDTRIVEDGKAVAYYGANRYGQYLNEQPTGQLNCLCVDAGSAEDAMFTQGAYLEVVSMSGLQVDFYTDYIGGEVRLAYYCDGKTVRPVTGLSITGKLSEVLAHLRLSKTSAVYNRYMGPAKARLPHMKIF